MTNYLFPIKIALIFFPFLAMGLTMPFAIYQYRKYGYINKLRVLVVFSFIFYLLAAYYMVILPLPKSRDVKSNQREDIEYTNLKPFQFIEDIKRESNFNINNPSSFKLLLKERAFLQVIFNVLLTLPLGVYLSYYFNKDFKTTIIISFITSMFFELTQLSGLYGIYNAPYRIFDVDDLFLNTLGGGLGYLIAPYLTFFLPKANRLDEDIDLSNMRVSFTRRFIAFSIDSFILSFIYTDNFFRNLIVQFIYFILLVYITNGRTVGLWLVRSKIVGQVDRLKFREIFIRNSILFLGVFQVNYIFSLIINLNLKNPLYYMTLFISLSHLVYILFLLGNFISSIYNKDRFFYEKISKTRVAINKF